MGTLNITVAHPQVRADGSAFDPLTELASWQASMRVVGAGTWSPIDGPNPPSVTTRSVGNLPTAQYEAQVTWTDIYGQVSDPAEDSTEAPIPAKPAPGGVSAVFVPT